MNGAVQCKKKNKKKCKKKGFGSWKDNGMGMLCNGYKCKPKPTRFPQPTTTKAVQDGQFNDNFGMITFDHLYQTLVELNAVHPLRNFKYRVVLQKYHENVRKWLKMAKKWPKLTFSDPK